MIKIIEDRSKIEQIHRKFRDTIIKNFSEKINCLIGYKGRSIDDEVYYSDEVKLWASFGAENNRYWNAFGIGRPQNKSNSIIGEINFPFENNRRIQGVFAEDNNGEILVLHRGTIGGGRKGIGKKLFSDNYREKPIDAIDGDIETEFYFVGDLKSKLFPKQLARFIYEIDRIKKLVKNPSAVPNLKLAFSDEHFGISVSEPDNPIKMERIHGIVVNSLAKEIEKKGLSIGNNREMDLYVYNKREQIIALFEIKTTLSTQSLYSAVGQLLLYSIPIKNKVKLVAVLPSKLKYDVSKRFNELGIDILYYYWEKEEPIFINLDKLFYI